MITPDIKSVTHVLYMLKRPHTLRPEERLELQGALECASVNKLALQFRKLSSSGVRHKVVKCADAVKNEEQDLDSLQNYSRGPLV